MASIRPSKLLGFLALIAGLAAGVAQAQTTLTYTSMPGDSVGQGQTKTISSPQYTVTAQMISPEFIRFNFTPVAPATGFYSLDLASIKG